MSFTIRRLGPADAAGMRALNRLYAAAFDDSETYAPDRPDDEWLAHQLGKDAIIILVAEEDGEVVGGLTAYELPKLERAHSEIYLYDLAVGERDRRRGIATALIAELQHIAAETDAWVIFVQADHGDEPAVALYAGLGTREDVMHFDIAPRLRGERKKPGTSR